MTTHLGPLSRAATGSTESRESGVRLDSVTALLGSALLVIIVSVLCIAFLSSPNSLMEGNTLWNGLADFADRPSVSMTDNVETIQDSGAKALVTVPRIPHTDEQVAAMRAFVEAGGRLVVLSDDAAGNRLASALGLPVQFRSDTIIDPLFCFKNPALPRVTDFSADLAAAGVRSVVLNSSTVLEVGDVNSVIAWSSPESYLASTDYGPDGRPVEHGPFPIAARFEVGQGEVVFVADSSLVENGMMALEDNNLFVDSFLPPDPQPGDILVDRAHLEKAPMDEAKRFLGRAQRAFNLPQYSLPVLLLIFIVGAQYFARRRNGGKPDGDS